MACARCDFKGYIETTIGRDNGWRPILEQCPVCRDARAYTNRLREKLREKLVCPAAPVGVRGFKPRVIQGGKTDGNNEPK